MYAGQQKDGNRLYDYISKKFNIELEIRPINWGDWNEKVRIWVASGDMPEILRSDVQASTHSEFINWAKQGIFRELPDELLSKYPNLKRLNEELISDEYVKVDGKRYAWLASIQKADYNNVSQMMFYYRKDWAKKVGIYHENNEYTFEEMKAMAKAFVEEDVVELVRLSVLVESVGPFLGLQESIKLIQNGKVIYIKMVSMYGDQESLKWLKV